MLVVVVTLTFMKRVTLTLFQLLVNDKAHINIIPAAGKWQSTH